MSNTKPNERIILPCECGGGHTLQVEADCDPVWPTLNFYMNLDCRLSWWKRLLHGLAYIFGVQKNWCDFDDIIIRDPSQAKDIKILCDLFIKAEEKRITEQERKNSIGVVISEIHKHRNLVEECLPLLSARLGRSEEEIKGGLLATDFPRGNLTFTLPDGSILSFRNAFFITTEKETIIFTEHCGYHSFPRR